MPYRFFVSNILNCEPFREIEIEEVNYFGWYQLGRKTKDRKNNGYFHIITTFQMYVFYISTQRKERG